jgi:hypothetical protein
VTFCHRLDRYSAVAAAAVVVVAVRVVVAEVLWFDIFASVSTPDKRK